jgi:hypothetical protein
MSSKRNQLWNNELAALFLAAFLGSIFLLGLGMLKALMLFCAAFALFQPIILYDYFKSRR